MTSSSGYSLSKPETAKCNGGLRHVGRDPLIFLSRAPCISAPFWTLDRKYLRMNLPSRPFMGPPQLTHVISRSVVGTRGASTRTTSYFAAQFGHSNCVVQLIARRIWDRGG